MTTELIILACFGWAVIVTLLLLTMHLISMTREAGDGLAAGHVSRGPGSSPQPGSTEDHHVDAANFDEAVDQALRIVE